MTYRTVPIKGCKGKCLKWHTVHYAGKHNVVNAYTEGKVGCSVCEVLFDKSHVKNGKFCKCCGKQVRFKAKTSSVPKKMTPTQKANKSNMVQWCKKYNPALLSLLKNESRLQQT